MPTKSKASLHSELRALEATVAALRDVIDERDRRYHGEREAERRETNVALTAAEKAMLKAEDSQRIYNQTHNELQRKMDAQHKEMLPRDVAELRFSAIEENVARLRESQSAASGWDDAVKHVTAISRSTHHWLVGLAVSIVLAAVVFVFTYLLRGG